MHRKLAMTVKDTKGQSKAGIIPQTLEPTFDDMAMEDATLHPMQRVSPLHQQQRCSGNSFRDLAEFLFRYENCYRN